MTPASMRKARAVLLLGLCVRGRDKVPSSGQGKSPPLT